MNISSATPSTPVKMPEASEPKAPAVKLTPMPAFAHAAADAFGRLPPGQGTRIDQLV